MAREFDFYIVPTPIGNIGDITFRAVEVLKKVDIIACEDTRTTQKLLNHYNIKTKCISYHKYNERERVDFILEKLKENKKIALVSDAGTPLICDPGNIIAEELLKNGYRVNSLPGASAVTTFVSSLPKNGEDFKFIGFISRGEKQIEEVMLNNVKENVVFYESPERILKTLEIIKKVRGDIVISLGRELTKLYEEIITDKISNIQNHYKEGIKGEIVCMVYRHENSDEKTLETKVKTLKNKGFKDKEISIILSELEGYNKNEVYKKSLNLK